jgi:catechol 2,3-dioxygenase-like lactoylglutathione lyase family enzyme
MSIPMCQVALSVNDLERSCAWYRALGLVPMGGQGPLTGEVPATMLGLAEVDLSIKWLAGRDAMSQLELMHFAAPAPRALPAGWNPRHAGYGVVGLIVSDFEALVRELHDVDTERVLTGSAGARSLWLKDPDGIWVEIMEKDPLGLHRPDDSPGDSSGDAPVRTASIRSVTLTVADMARAKKFWTVALGMSAEGAADTVYNAFPPMAGAGAFDQEIIRSGSFLLRLLKPKNGAIVPRAADRRLSDLGVLNVAAIADDAQSFHALFTRFKAMGYPLAMDAPMDIGGVAAAIYGHDDQGNSIEMGYVLPGEEVKYGWRR